MENTALVLYAPPAKEPGEFTNSLMVDHFAKGGDKGDNDVLPSQEQEKNTLVALERVLRENVKLFPNSTTGYHVSMNDASFKLIREDPSRYEKLNKNDRVALCNEHLERLTGFKRKRPSRSKKALEERAAQEAEAAATAAANGEQPPPPKKKKSEPVNTASLIGNELDEIDTNLTKAKALHALQVRALLATLASLPAFCFFFFFTLFCTALPFQKKKLKKTFHSPRYPTNI